MRHGGGRHGTQIACLIFANTAAHAPFGPFCLVMYAQTQKHINPIRQRGNVSSRIKRKESDMKKGAHWLLFSILPSPPSLPAPPKKQVTRSYAHEARRGVLFTSLFDSFLSSISSSASLFSCVQCCCCCDFITRFSFVSPLPLSLLPYLRRRRGERSRHLSLTRIRRQCLQRRRHRRSCRCWWLWWPRRP